MDLFEEVAKFRAARRLFAKIMKERFQAKDARSYLFRIFAGSCGSTLVSQQPINNIVRVTMHALMGILAGNQAIHTACWDEGYALPSEDSATIALRTQQILAYECGLCNTIDPLAGSYYLESLTNEIEKRAEEYLKKIDGMGGMLGAIDNGFVYREIQDSSVRFQERVCSGERTIVGLNKFGSSGEKGVIKEHDMLEIDSQVEEVQKKKLAAIKLTRKENEVKDALDELGNGVEKNENLMPHIIHAVKRYATIGEICSVLRQKWGEFRGPTYV
jgi:methylmalonyl-CoA mutase N-terminal domain/subunit